MEHGYIIHDPLSCYQAERKQNHLNLSGFALKKTFIENSCLKGNSKRKKVPSQIHILQLSRCRCMVSEKKRRCLAQFCPLPTQILPLYQFGGKKSVCTVKKRSLLSGFGGKINALWYRDLRVILSYAGISGPLTFSFFFNYSITICLGSLNF